MGFLSKILSYTRLLNSKTNLSKIKHDSGSGTNQTSVHFQGANEDSVPMVDDFIATVSVQRTGRHLVVGFVDPKQQQKAAAGEHRSYARDEKGEEVIQFHLKGDGTGVLNNSKGKVELTPLGEFKATNNGGYMYLLEDGTVNINSVTISPDGVLTVPLSFMLKGKEIAGHKHLGKGKDAETGENI